MDMRVDDAGHHVFPGRVDGPFCLREAAGGADPHDFAVVDRHGRLHQTRLGDHQGSVFYS